MRYIESPRHSPIEHLTTVLRTELLPGQADTPFALLILSTTEYSPVWPMLQQFLIYFASCLSDVEQRLDNLFVFIEALLGYSPGWVQLLLCDMHSLLKLDRTNDENYDCVNCAINHLRTFFSIPYGLGIFILTSKNLLNLLVSIYSIASLVSKFAVLILKPIVKSSI